MMLPALLSEGVNKGRLSIERVVQVACENPAKTAGIWGRKGSLLPGFDADVVLVDLSREVKVNKGHINTRSGWSLMEGHTFKGWPVKTILRGKVTAEWAKDSPGMRPVGEPRGKYLRRELGIAEAGQHGSEQSGARQPHRPLARRSVSTAGLQPGNAQIHQAAREVKWPSGTMC